MNVLKTIIMAAALVLVSVTASLAQVKTVKFDDRVGKNQFQWFSDAPLEKVQGTAEGITGSLTLNPAKLATLRGNVSAVVSTMKSGNEMRDQHLQSTSWLDATNHPKIAFTIESVKSVKGKTGVAVGKFTMHGVTKPMQIPFSMKYLPESAATKKRAPGDLMMIAATFNLSLKDFNVAGSKGTIGNKISDSIKVVAQLFGTTAQ